MIIDIFSDIIDRTCHVIDQSCFDYYIPKGKYRADLNLNLNYVFCLCKLLFDFGKQCYMKKM